MARFFDTKAPSPPLLLLLFLCCSALSLFDAHASASSLSQTATKGDLNAALKNLSQAMCPGGRDSLLSVVGNNVTVVLPGNPPLHLDETDHILAFFNSSFLPCHVSLIIADVAFGKGSPLSDPDSPCPAPKKGKFKYAVTRLVYVDYEVVDVGKAFALWTLDEQEKDVSVRGGIEDPPPTPSSWKLTAIGWSSDLPAQGKHSSLESSLASLSQKVPTLGDIEERGKRRGELRGVSCNAVSDKKKGGLSAWEGVAQALQEYRGNLSAGCAEVAAQYFTSFPHPFVLMEPHRPPEQFFTRQDLQFYVQQWLGMDVMFRLLSVWEIKTKSLAHPGSLKSSKAHSAFVLGSLKAISNGTVVLYGSTLSLWEASYAPSANGKPKALHYALRWEFFAPANIPPTVVDI